MHGYPGRLEESGEVIHFVTRWRPDSSAPGRISGSSTRSWGTRRAAWGQPIFPATLCRILPKPWRRSLSIEGLRPTKMTSLPFLAAHEEGRANRIRCSGPDRNTPKYGTVPLDIRD